MSAFDVLTERGFFYQLTDSDALRERLAAGPVTFYVGIDPTADSMHVGHLLPIMAARWLQRSGHRAIILVGGGTAMVGDPSGKTEMRQMLTVADIEANAAGLQKQLSRFLDFDGNKGKLVNNIDWLGSLHYIEFLRDVGRHFSVNKMLSAESVRMRLEQEQGLSFIEFNYSLLQAYDFYILCRDEGCEFQLGGQDQWGNIVAGIDLTRRMASKTVLGATIPLLTDQQGRKFGKSVAGAVWLDADRTPPFEYYQFWRNVEDAEVKNLLAYFTALPMDEVNRLAELPAPAINRAKEILAYEATALAHGVDVAKGVFLTASSRFGLADPEGKIPTSSDVRLLKPTATTQDLPTHTVTATDVADGIWIVALFAAAGLEKSNGAARRLIQGGGGYLNDEKISSIDYQVTVQDFSDGQLLIRAGKKNVRRVCIAD